MNICKLFREVLIAILGGFIGAIFGIVASGKMLWSSAWFLVMIYSIMVIVIILLLEWILKKINSKRKKEELKPHFVRTIDYNKNEPWKTDIILGQKGSNSHGHIALSGAQMYYAREESGKEIVKDGFVQSEEVKK